MSMKTAIWEPRAHARARSGHRILRNLKRDRFLYLLIVPFIAWYLVFQYYPMLGLQMAFKKYSIYKGLSGSPWVGFDNFVTFFKGPYFLRTLKNTILISLYSLIFAFPAPIILALLLNEVKNMLFKRTVQTLTYLPHFISIVIVAGFVTNFLSPTNGIVNLLLAKLGLEKLYFLVVPEYFRTIFISMNIWREVGFGSIIYIAALSGIHPELHEAAVIDGANKWKRVLHVTLPGIMPTIMIMLILKIGNLLDVGYEAIILLYQPSTYEVSDVISTYVYRTGLQDGRYDIGTAVGLFNSVVGLVLVICANKLSKKYTESGLW
ncbi:putative aldouronate transport system permease protein [Paenibacillus qinlingensis]|uniref:Aldouronate transport system permease protein n=2 Tax=Paenibacillus qinlingensis TaxID=1837343 RepID=A0ABU1NSS9_9BACL|nr:putative aldouronate transport system permease protein [Paenibacillus qinlingensis]